MQIIEISEPGASEETEDIVVGIDFGTTNSLISISKDHKASIVKTEEGAELVPSIIGFEEIGVVVGKKALQAKHHVRSIKRLFAKSSKEILRNENLRMLSDFLALGNDVPKLNAGKAEITLPEAASEIFRYLKIQAEKTLGTEVKKAVVTVPAHFNDAERGQVLLAAKLAGLEVLRLISEPTAAAYAYGLNQNSHGCYLIYDFGGGTFDISILNMNEGVLQVVATGGDNMLGGDDVDHLLADFIAGNLESEMSVEILQQAKMAKEQLSSQEEAEISGIKILQEQFEKIIDPIISRTIKIARDTFFDTEIEELDGIILVGGSSRMPLIAKKLKKEFDVQIFSNIDPDRIVAMGAALQAENLTAKTGNLLLDVLPLSVGLEIYGGIAEKIIMRNTPIPFSITKEFTTHVDNQTGMQFHIVQGEREMVKDCRSLARFELTGIKPQKAGRAKIEVNFAVDADGILSVTAREAETGLAHNIDIKPSYGLDEKAVNDIISNAFENAKQDHAERLLAESREEAKNLISGITKAVGETPDLLTDIERKEIDSAINSLQNLINLDNREKIILEMERLNGLAASFIQRHLDKGVELHLKGKNIQEINKNLK